MCVPKLLIYAFLLIVCLLPWSTPVSAAEVTENGLTQEAAKPNKSPNANRQKLIDLAVGRLIELQHEDGAWPYEGVYRVGGKIPKGYRVGGTAIVCSALISVEGKPADSVVSAVDRGVDLMLKELEHRLMKPSDTQRYDVRVWGHIYALDFFCRLKACKGFNEAKKKTEPWLKKLTEALVFQEIKTGGWNYANKRRHGCFVTAPAAQALLLAQEAGIDVPSEVLERTRKVLAASRNEDSRSYQYSGTANERRSDTLPGSIARGPVSEATMLMLGTGSVQDLKFALDAFHEHWDELEKRRKKNGTHLPPHGVAPYYFYYGHRYAAQAIRMLPKDEQEKAFKKFEAVLMKTKDEDHTWNDRVFEQSKAYGTAMSLLALSRDSVLLPKKIEHVGSTASSE